MPQLGKNQETIILRFIFQVPLCHGPALAQVQFLRWGRDISTRKKHLTTMWIALKWTWIAKTIYTCTITEFFLPGLQDHLYYWFLFLTFKKYIIVIIKVPIVPLCTSPNTLSHPTYNLILETEFSGFANLTKCWARQILLLQHLCQLADTYAYKVKK